MPKAFSTIRLERRYKWIQIVFKVSWKTGEFLKKSYE